MRIRINIKKKLIYVFTNTLPFTNKDMPVADRSTDDPPPLVVAVVGPPKVI